MSEKPWYTNKDLFEFINALQKDFNDLRLEMRETRAIIKRYNGLREEIGEVGRKVSDIKTRVDDIESKKKGAKAFGKSIRDWGGWIVAVVTFIYMLIKFYGGS